MVKRLIGSEMPPVTENIIVDAIPDAAGMRVVLTWASGAVTVSSFDHLARRGIFAALADPELFAQVRVGERGRSIVWPQDIDFCADALWFQAHPEDAPARAAETLQPAAE